MKKALILAYDFPPYVSVGGLRPYSWFKYMREFGVFPIVVTRQWSNRFGNHLDYVAPSEVSETIIEESEKGVILRTPYKPNLSNKLLLKYGEARFRFLRKSVSAYYEFAQYLFSVGPKANLYHEADKYLKENRADVIIATGDPFILFKYASQLSRKYSIPWIADYRDPWVQEKTFDSKFYKTWNTVFEKKILVNVSKILTVSTYIQKQIEENLSTKDFEILYNGYDPDILNAAKGVSQSKKILSIGFTGTIYEWHPIRSFLKVCNEMITDEVDFNLKLNFFGINKEKEIKELLRGKYKNLEEHVSFFPRMDNLKLATELAKQNVFLLFNDYSILGTKIFDYLAIKRKIILCYENDSESNILKEKYFCLKEIKMESNKLQADMISASNSGIVVRDSRHLSEVLKHLSRELKEKDFVACHSKNVEKYSRIKQVEQLAEIVKRGSQK